MRIYRAFPRFKAEKAGLLNDIAGFGCGFSTIVVGQLKHGEDSFERIIRCRTDVHS